MKNEIKNRLDAAIKIAKKAGQYALELRKSNNFVVTEKQKNDFVTTADKETEKLIQSELMSCFENDGFFGEEGKEIFGKGRWVVDPIDGTTNYFRNLSNWAVSIAYENDNQDILLGVVYAPESKDLYYAARGLGSFRNDEKIQVSKIKDIKYSINVCVPPHRYKEYYDSYMKKYNLIGRECSDIRSYGSCALEMCYIAQGLIDGYYELFLGYYDYAAAKVILEEAGGMFYSWPSSINNKINIIATNFELFSWYKNNIINEGENE